MIGNLLNHYHITASLGAGGMGEVLCRGWESPWGPDEPSFLRLE